MTSSKNRTCDLPACSTGQFYLARWFAVIVIQRGILTEIPIADRGTGTWPGWVSRLYIPPERKHNVIGEQIRKIVCPWFSCWSTQHSDYHCCYCYYQHRTPLIGAKLLCCDVSSADSSLSRCSYITDVRKLWVAFSAVVTSSSIMKHKNMVFRSSQWLFCVLYLRIVHQLYREKQTASIFRVENACKWPTRNMRK
jgi:hypothetical protein